MSYLTSYIQHPRVFLAYSSKTLIIIKEKKTEKKVKEEKEGRKMREKT